MKNKKPFYKRWWFILIVALVFFAAIGAGGEPEEAANEPEESEVQETEVQETEVQEDETGEVEEPEEPETQEPEEPELPEEIADLNPNSVRNDTTGEWQKVTTPKDVNMPENALAYYNEYMEDGGVHYIVSFATNTTTLISDVGSELMVTTTEYVDREEHSADTIGGGMLLQDASVNKESGEITEYEVN